jgi:hypothetical protein
VVPDESGAALVFADDGAGEPVDAGAPIARLSLAWGTSPDGGEDGRTADRQDVVPDEDSAREPFGDPFDDKGNRASRGVCQLGRFAAR